MGCCKRKADARKCIPLYIIGGVLVLIGLPLMVVGIVAEFMAADLVGYIGGICIFFGLGFFLLWHTFTIENIETGLAVVDLDAAVNQVRDTMEKSRVLDSSMVISTKNTGLINLAFEGEKVKLEEDDVSLTSIQDSNASLPLNGQSLKEGTHGDQDIETNVQFLNKNNPNTEQSCDVIVSTATT